jgi:hypothetical protein
LGVAPFAASVVSAEVLPATISTLVSEDSDSFEAASSRGLALSTMVEVTAEVTIRAVWAALKHNWRLLVPVTSP